MTEKRKFTKEEKLRLITEASEKGVTITLEKHGIYPATYYSWKKKFESMGEAGFRHEMTPEHLKEIKRLEKENALLKKTASRKRVRRSFKNRNAKKEVCLGEKKELAKKYIGLGLLRNIGG